MLRKRLDRDLWWDYNDYIYPPYYQMRVDIEEFHGLVGLIPIYNGQYHYWDLPKAGKTAVIGEGMTWLQLVPDGKKRVITAKYLPDKTISVWYVDVIENIEYDMDGVACFIDKYLDVIFTPQGDVIIDDRDELDEALETGDITKEQYDSALSECDSIIAELCSDIAKTEAVCSRILSHVNKRIADSRIQNSSTANSSIAISSTESNSLVNGRIENNEIENNSIKEDAEQSEMLCILHHDL